MRFHYLGVASLWLLPCVTAVTDCDPNSCDASAPPCYDGRCNNLEEPFKGAAYSDENPLGTLSREPSMQGYIGANNDEDPRGETNPRYVSNQVLKTPDLTNPTLHRGNLLLTFFGQFLSHDMVRTVFPPFPPNQANALIDIVPDSESGATKVVDILPTDSVVKNGYKEQRNGVSSVLDLNSVYGNNATIVSLLRENDGNGRLLTSKVTTEFTWLPKNEGDFRLCKCTNITDGTPWHSLDDTNSNFEDIERESAGGFTPEPFNTSKQIAGIEQPCFSVAAFCLPPKGFQFPDNPQCNSPPFPFPECHPSPSPDPNDPVIAPFPGVALPPLVFESCFEPARRLEEIECVTNTEDSRYRDESRWEIPQGRDWPPRGDEAPGVPFDAVFAGTEDRSKVFVSGDDRNIENVGIFLLHNLFLREHNYQAGILQSENPNWDEETLFQEARRMTTASFHKIVYDEWLPVILGQPLYEDKGLAASQYVYDSNIDPSTSNIFVSATVMILSYFSTFFLLNVSDALLRILQSTAAFRFGHTTVPTELYLRDPITHERIPNTKVQRPFRGGGPRWPLEDEWFSLPAAGQIGFFLNTEILAYSDGEDNVMAGMIFEKGHKVDETVSDVLRSLTVSSPFIPFRLMVDVPVLNMRRGRTHGLPGYNTVRTTFHPEGSVYGPSDGPLKCQKGDDTDPLNCFLIFCRTPILARKVQDLYGKVDKVDPWVGMLLEAGKEHVEGGLIGPTMAHIIAEQMRRTRDGDRFFLPADLVQHATGNNLATLIRRHHGVENVPDDIFVVQDE